MPLRGYTADDDKGAEYLLDTVAAMTSCPTKGCKVKTDDLTRVGDPKGVRCPVHGRFTSQVIASRERII